MSQPVEFLNNPHIAALIALGKEYRKRERTLLRLPKSDEFTAGLDTYVKDGDSIRLEMSKATIEPNELIARNPNPIGKTADGENIFNEWCIGAATVVKSYGQAVLDSLTTEFPAEGFIKTATIRVTPLTKVSMEILGQLGDVLTIKVSWTDQPQFAKIGDSLTSGGYSISKHDMEGYEPVSQFSMPIKDLRRIWDQLCETPIDDAGRIATPVEGFPAGMPLLSVHEWLEQQSDEFRIEALLNPSDRISPQRQTV